MKKKSRIILSLLFLLIGPSFVFGQGCTPPPTFNGRIAWTADGNESDRDEYLATPYMAAILQAANVELVHFAYNDQFLTRSNPSQTNGNVGNRPEVMRATVQRALGAYNSLGSNIYDCNGRQNSSESQAGITHLSNLIINAEGNSRLYICIAGGARYVGLALQRAANNGATVEDFQNVTIVSHSNANNLNSRVDFPGVDWDMSDIEARVGPRQIFEGLVVANYANRGSIHNEELFVNVNQYNFIRNNQTNPFIAPIWQGFLDSRKSDFDPSDAGMAYIVLYHTNAINQASARLIQPSDFVQEARDLVNNCPGIGGGTNTCNNPPSATVTQTNPTCAGGNGEITFTFPDTQGRVRIEFSIDGGQNYLPSVDDTSGTFTVSNLDAGTFETYVRWGNDECPTALSNISLNAPTNCGGNNTCNNPPSATVTRSNPTCAGGDGTITFTFPDTSGRVRIEFSIDGGQNYLPSVDDTSGTFTVSNLDAGTFETYVRWGNDECPTSLNNITLNAPTNCGGNTTCTGSDIPTATVNRNNPTCAGSDGTITFTFPDNPNRGGIEFSVDGGNTYGTRVADNSGTFTVNNLDAGTFETYVRWGNDDCPTSLGSITLNAPTNCGGNTTCTGSDIPTATVTRTNATCAGGDGTITFTFPDNSGRGGIEFSVDGGNTYGARVADNSGTFTVNNLDAGSYNTYVRWGNDDCPTSLGSITLNAPSNCGGNTSSNYTNVNGLIVMEAENTPSDLDQWIFKTDVPNFTGTGHIEFTGNTQASGPPTSPLEYTFTVTETGVYQLIIKSRKRLAGAPADRSNDSFIRLDGDYDESPDAGDNHLDDAPLRILRRNSKLFGGRANEWGWSERIDLGHDNKRFPVYSLRAGETYTFVVSGRSMNYNIDKIVFFNTAQYSLGQARTAGFNAAETLTTSSKETTPFSSNTNTLKAFPNPTSGSLTLNQSANWTVYHTSGAVIAQGKGNTIDLSPFSDGLYFIQSNGNIIKVIKE